uniref:Uncharacterized protein n=1 Tax=Oryza brachyantha TaxID=4533 RepID=J3LKZ0_ORYBR
MLLENARKITNMVHLALAVTHTLKLLALSCQFPYSPNTQNCTPSNSYYKMFNFLSQTWYNLTEFLEKTLPSP